MGQSFTKLFGFMFTKEARIMMFGLGDAGKTTILYTLKLGKVITTNPTIVFNVETLRYKNISFTVWDFGAYDMYRLQDSLMRHYCHNAHGHIFVVDSTSSDHVVEARDKLHEMMLKEILYKDAVLLVFANKQDLPGAMNAVEITDKLGLHSLGLQHWYVWGMSATSGEGPYEGLDWLSNNIADKVNHLMDYPSYIIPPIW